MATKKKKIDGPEAPQENVDATKFEGMRSMYLILQNFKNIESKVINIGGRSMIFLGPNGVGKSSLIQAMQGSLNSKLLPAVAVKKGEQHAVIHHKIAGNVAGEYKEYTITIHFNEKTGEGELTLKDEKGEDVKRPASKIKEIIGNVSFDVTSWLNAKKEDKLKTLKTLTGKGVEIDIIGMNIKDLRAKRKVKIDRYEELQGALNNHGMSQEEITRYSNPVDLTSIQAEMEQVSSLQSQYDGVVMQVDGFFRAMQASQDTIARINEDNVRIDAEISRLLKQRDTNNTNIVLEGQNASRNQMNVDSGQSWLATATRPTMEAVSAKMSAAVTHNEKNSQIVMLSEHHKEMTRLVREAESMKADIDAKMAERDKIIASSQLPVPGLSFTDEDILLDGLPLEEGQQNTAKLWHIGVQVAKALNPTYRGIFIHDGSLFDKEHLHALIEEVEKDGYFAIIEQVAYEGTELEVKFTEGELI